MPYEPEPVDPQECEKEVDECFLQKNGTTVVPLFLDFRRWVAGDHRQLPFDCHLGNSSNE